MLTIAVELLAGRYVATSYNDRNQAEWPPHPARLFSALVATWAEYDEGSEDSEREREALAWLERLPAPDVLASGEVNVAHRTVAPVFVPVNDVSVVTPPNRSALDEALAALEAAGDPKSKAKVQKNVEKAQKKYDDAVARALLPGKESKETVKKVHEWFREHAGKQPRTFPSVTPPESQFAFRWPSADPPEPLREALARLLSRLVRLGHSSSMVRAWIASTEQTRAIEQSTVCLVHSPTGKTMLRWVSSGQLAQLSAAYELHRGVETRVLPARVLGYEVFKPRPSESEPAHSVFDEQLVVFARTDGPQLPITAVAGVARQFRRALMSYAGENVPELISGHRADGSPSQSEHLAIAPLPLVLGPHPDGRVQGIALLIPRSAIEQDRERLMVALGEWERATAGDDDDDDDPQITLQLDHLQPLRLRRVRWGSNAATLRSNTWTESAQRWATVTPVALDKNPGDLHDPDPQKRAMAFTEATSIVRGSLARVLPGQVAASARIDVLRSCVVQGTAKPRNYPRFPHVQSRPQRVLVHVRVAFAQPVQGPIVAGAGRYQGLGLFVPLPGSLPLMEQRVSDGADIQ